MMNIHARFALLLFLFGFIWSHTHLLMSIDYSIYYDTEFQKGGNITFNFVEGVKLALDSSAYLVAVLIIIFSGILPYLKLIHLFFFTKGIIFVDQINRFAYLDLTFLSVLITIFGWPKTQPIFGDDLFLNITANVFYSTYIFYFCIVGTQIYTFVLLSKQKNEFHRMHWTIGSVFAKLIGLGIFCVFVNVPIFSSTITFLSQSTLSEFSIINIIQHLSTVSPFFGVLLGINIIGAPILSLVIKTAIGFDGTLILLLSIIICKFQISLIVESISNAVCDFSGCILLTIELYPAFYVVLTCFTVYSLWCLRKLFITIDADSRETAMRSNLIGIQWDQYMAQQHDGQQQFAGMPIP